MASKELLVPSHKIDWLIAEKGSDIRRYCRENGTFVSINASAPASADLIAPDLTYLTVGGESQIQIDRTVKQVTHLVSQRSDQFSDKWMLTPSLDSFRGTAACPSGSSWCHSRAKAQARKHSQDYMPLSAIWPSQPAPKSSSRMTSDSSCLVIPRRSGESGHIFWRCFSRW